MAIVYVGCTINNGGRAAGVERWGFVTVFTSTVFDYRQVYELFLGEQKTNLRMRTKKQQQKPTLNMSSTVHPCLLKKRNRKWYRKRQRQRE